MGLEDLLKKGENAVDGQTAADQQAQSGAKGGHESMEDTVVDSGKNLLSSSLMQIITGADLSCECSRR